jgi:hypothetical protein
MKFGLLFEIQRPFEDIGVDQIMLIMQTEVIPAFADAKVA